MVPVANCLNFCAFFLEFRSVLVEPFDIRQLSDAGFGIFFISNPAPGAGRHLLCTVHKCECVNGLLAVLETPLVDVSSHESSSGGPELTLAAHPKSGQIVLLEMSHRDVH